MKNSQESKRIDAVTSTPCKNALTSTFDKGKLNVILHKVKQSLCRHRQTRGVTLLTHSNHKVVRCIKCEKLLVADSILGDS